MKAKVEDCRTIKISFLKNNGFLNGNSHQGTITWSIGGYRKNILQINTFSNDMRVILAHSQINQNTNKAIHYSYSVDLVTTDCNYGGKRYWFICKGCHTKVCNLHQLDSSPFICRKCLDLSYESRNISRAYRRFRAMYKGVEFEDLRVKYYKGRLTRRARGLLGIKRNVDKKAVVGQ